MFVHCFHGYGRFLSPDPGYDYDQLDPMSWNLYSYVRGNPIRFLDLTGMDLTEFRKIIEDIINELTPKYKEASRKNIEYGFFIFKNGNKYLLGKHIEGENDKKVIFKVPPLKKNYPPGYSEDSEHFINIIFVGMFHFHQNESDISFSFADVNALIEANKKTNGAISFIFSMDNSYIYGLEIDNNINEDLSKVSKELEKEIRIQSKFRNKKDALRIAMKKIAKKYKSLHYYRYNRKRKRYEEIK